MDVVSSLQAQALLAVLAEDGDYLMRRVCRWYSTTYHTPLHEVEDLPPEYVLQHYFEASFEQMPEKERKKLALEICETPEEKAARVSEEEGQSDDDFAKQIVAEEKARKKKRKKKVKQAVQEAQDADQDFLAGAAEKIRKAAEQLRTQVSAPPPPTDLPEISMSFDNDNLLNDEDSLSPPRK